MTLYQWVMLGLGAFGFLVTWTGTVAGAIWVLGKLNTDIAEKIAANKQDFTNRLAAEAMARATGLSEAFAARDADLDSIRSEFGETGHALRRHIETVERRMHEIELAAERQYVQKGEFERATESLRKDIKDLGADIKADLKDLKSELTPRH